MRRTWLVFAVSLVGLACFTALRLVTGGSPGDWLAAALVAAAAVAALAERRSVELIETGRRGEAESFARILRALSRSVSPDAIVGAIVEELGSGTAADHIVVVRRRPDARLLEATLVTIGPHAATSTTTLPITDLDDPDAEKRSAAAAVAAVRGRRMQPIAVGAGSGLAPLGAPVPAPLAVAARDLTPRLMTSRTADHAAPLSAGAPDRIAERIAGRVRAAYGLRNTLAAALRIDGRVEGAIVLSRRTDEAWEPTSRRLLAGAAIEASAALARAYSQRDAEARASTDALTGLPNRRYFDEYVALVGKRRRADDRVGVLMIDIDRFKAVNDTFGHAAGDSVLRAVAGAIGGAVREDDVPSRFGGEEFAVLLRNPSPAIATDVGERVRKAVAALDLRPLGVPGVTVSVGVAVATRPGEPIDRLIESADAALFRAKRAGRDRVVAV
ncbi:MAG: diguanylate cyclase [Chloroflexota bacterium]